MYKNVTDGKSVLEVIQNTEERKIEALVHNGLDFFEGNYIRKKKGTKNKRECELLFTHICVRSICIYTNCHYYADIAISFYVLVF